MAVSEGMAERSEEMADAGVALAAEGAAEVTDAAVGRQVAKEIAKEGIADVVKGAAEMGASEVMEDIAEEMEKKSKK